MELRNHHFKAEDLDEQSRKVKVRLSAFGNEDAHGDIIAPGAFAKTIKERFQRIKYLWQHNTWEPVGKWAELYEDAEGLVGVGELSKAQRGEDLLQFYKEGIITEHSIGFDAILSEHNPDKQIRIIKEIRLWEGSAVTWGANENTPLLEVAKSLNQNPLDFLKDREARLLKFLRTSTASDEAMDNVEIELRHILETYKTLIAAEATKAAPPKPEPLNINLVELFKTI